MTQETARQVSTGNRVALLVAGDLLGLMIFAAIGRASHHQATGLDTITQIAFTAAPFLAGWLFAAPWVGAFRSDLHDRPAALAARTVLAWLLGCPIGLGLRALLLQRSIPLSFAIVTFLTVLAILVVWRVLFAIAIRRRMPA
ncbi:MAG TPA: DUF3054 domain-containing protein [Roseiflexaceae bacterium]|nr:DUF3054 domain-containing protein [Roseiflexaceae bacterium]HMP38795.1 DUF3054 domain-containing protein [Roseiflexaceae bacterium]